ncbi:MAG TPA: IclR family transcriptional regulator [Solirubrobacteraceae bacterium]|jgi:IclR family pca regulon transcriptional regulator
MPRTAVEASVPQLREPRYSQSLERGLSILGCYTPDRRVLGVAEVADELGMSRSTTHRYMSTLVVLGYLEQVQARRYRLGLRVTDLGMSALNATGVGEHARPYLEELSLLVSYSVSLAVLDAPEIVLVERLPSRRLREGDRFGHSLRAGSRLPSYCTAMGKVLLASSRFELAELLDGGRLKCRGPNTITSRKRLREELERVRSDGLAMSHQELVLGRSAIAVPVKDATEEVVAAVG